MFFDDLIKSKNLTQTELKRVISTLNNNVLKYLNNPNYCQRVQTEIIDRFDDKKFSDNFVSNVRETNLFVEAPAFSEVDIQSLLKYAIRPNEDVIIGSETIKYIKSKMKLDVVSNGDVRLKNIFCAPIYTTKLYKISAHIISARDFGRVKAITQQPVKGRASGGGSKLGSKWPLHIVIYVEQLREFGKHPMSKVKDNTERSF